MQDQPKAKPYRSSSFFKDGLSSRSIVDGTVPRGWLRADTEFFTGKKNKSPATTTTSTVVTRAPAQGQAPNKTPSPGGTMSTPVTQPAPLRTTPTSNASGAQVAAAYPDDVDKFPFPITQQILDRGQQRFQIFCSVCHGMTGDADGMVVRRGFRKPPSYYEQRLREAPVGHFFDVMTNGWGAMPSYASQVPVQDRWAIIAYIRSLQLSREPSTLQAPAASTQKSGGQK
jgi:mono/diheme cytochrome c family protein